MSSKESIIKSLYEATTGRKLGQKNLSMGTYDERTGTYYCGEDANIPFYIPEDAKRYIASRHFDYMHQKVNSDNKPLSESELRDNQIRAEALEKLMKKFGIPVADYSKR